MAERPITERWPAIANIAPARVLADGSSRIASTHALIDPATALVEDPLSVEQQNHHATGGPDMRRSRGRLLM